MNMNDNKNVIIDSATYLLLLALMIVAAYLKVIDAAAAAVTIGAILMHFGVTNGPNLVNQITAAVQPQPVVPTPAPAAPVPVPAPIDPAATQPKIPVVVPPTNAV